MRKPTIRKPSRPQTEVYTASHASSWMHNALPQPLTSFYFLLMAGSITGLAYFIGDKWFGNGALWSTVAIATMTVIGLIFMGLHARKAKKAAQEQGEGFETGLRDTTSGWDNTVSSAQEIAKVDQLRTAFLEGIQTFQDYGKDLYSMPWYVMVGGPGSGKTEAIRNSELRFPDNVTKLYQGTGGTYSMDWWFTNEAIILDTAGAMLMEPESAARFKEFLKLLRTHRAACPINGMILTIPVKSLLSDTRQKAEEKARTIAAQLALIQKTLDVRFPIYLMVSMSDLLPGFREFCDMDGQSKFERQMLGWANPAPLGEPFSPETIDAALHTISRRLQSRCLAMLENPVPVDRAPGARRADEVDLVYNFPQVVRNLAPKLKFYLDVIFQTGAWAQKPPFFRGVFFTTAMREAAPLDAELAKSLGLRLDQLPPGSNVARDKSVFLRDFFLEKVFPEKGLVTRLFDVRSHLRKRLTTFYTATGATLLLALGFAWIVKDRIENQLSEDQAMWASANATWQNGTFLRVIGRSASWSDQLPDRPAWYIVKGGSAGSKASPPIDELGKIRDRVEAKIGLSWVFYPIPEWRDFLERRKLAYSTLFEGSVMKPVLDAARERLLWDVAPGNTTTAETQQRLATAYQRLVEFESWLDAGTKKRPSQQDWQRWFQDLLVYITDPAPPGGLPATAGTATAASSTPAPPDKHLVDNLAKDLALRAHELYATEVNMTKRRWMQDPENQAESPLRLGADFIFGKTRAEAASNDASRRDAIERIQSALQDIARAEDNLLSMVDNKPQGPRNEVITEGLKPLEQALSEYTRISGGLNLQRDQSRLSMEVVSATAKTILDVADTLDEAPEGLEYAATLARKTKLGVGGVAEGPANADGTWMAASQRYRAYLDSFSALRSSTIGFSTGNIVGNLSQKLQEAAEHIKTASAATAVPPQPPPDQDKAKDKDKPADTKAQTRDKICTYLQKFRGTPLIAQVFRDYEQELRTLLGQTLSFPLVQHSRSYESVYAFEKTCKTLEKIDKDVEAIAQFSGPLYQCIERSPVEDIFKKLEVVNAIKAALSSNLTIEVDAVEPAKITNKQTETLDPAFTPPPPIEGAIPPPPGPKTSVTEAINEGWTKITVMIAGSQKVGGPPNGESKVVEYGKGFDKVSIILTFTPPPPATEKTYRYDSPSGNWPLLRELAGRRINRFDIGGSGKIFVIKSSPSLPVGSWPDAKDFAPSTRP